MDIEQLRERYDEFVKERNWGEFHTPQNLAMAISVESNELLENFLWMNNPSRHEVTSDDELMDDVRDEMADVMIYLLGLANRLDIELLAAVEQKMDENDERFDEEAVSEMNSTLREWQ